MTAANSTGAPSPGTSTGAATLRRGGMGLRTVTSTSTGLAFAAIEYLAAAGLIAYVAGNLAWVAIAAAGLFALIAWACFGELNGLFPTAAAIRLYMARAFDDRIALVITFTYLSTIILVLAADAFIVGSAISHALGAPPIVTALVIAVLLAFATVANLRGLNVAARVQDVATYAIIAVTILVSIVAVLHAKGADVAPQQHHGPGAWVQAIALGVLLYSAFEWVTTSAEEVDEVRLIPRGMLFALGILAVTCGLVATGMAHLLSRHELSSAYPQLYLGRHAMGAFGFALMAVVTGITAVNTFNSGFITASRFVYATAREGSLPQGFARLNDKAVPYVPVFALAGASMVVAIVVALTGDFQVLLSVGASLEAGIYAIAAICVLRLRGRYPDAIRPFRAAGGKPLLLFGIVIFTILALTAGISVNNKPSLVPIGIIVLLGVASSYYVLRVLPGMRAAAEAQRAATGPRRPRRPGGPDGGPESGPPGPLVAAAVQAPPPVVAKDVPAAAARAVPWVEAAALWRGGRRERGVLEGRDRILAGFLAVQLVAAVIFGGVLVHALRQKQTVTTLSSAPGTNGPSAAASASASAHPTQTASTGARTIAVGGQAGSSGSAGSGGGGGGGPSVTTGPGAIAAGQPIKIGAIVTQTGAINFAASAQATKAYIDMVNARGGVNGHKIQLILDDDQLSSSLGYSEAQQLIADGVFAFAAFNAPITEGYQPFQSLVDANRIPLIGSYGESLEYKDANMFAFTADYVHYGYEMGQFLAQKGAKKPALLYIDNSPDTNANNEIERGFADGLHAGGCSCTATVNKVQATQATYDGIVSQWRLAGVDGFASIVDNTAYSRLLQAQSRANYYPTHVADPLFDLPSITSMPGADGTYVAADMDFLENGAPAVSQYVSAVQARGQQPDYIGEAGWVDAEYLVQALSKLGKTFTRAQLLAAVNGLGGYVNGFTRQFSIAPGYHDMNKCLKFGKIVGGKLAQVQGWTCDSERP